MSKQGKTLVILSPGFPANEADSTCVPPQQVFVKNLKQNFPALNIIVLAFQYPFLRSEYQWHGITVIAFGGKNKGRFSRLRNWMRVWIKLRKLNMQYELIGLLSFWMGECAFMANIFAKRTRLKHFYWILGQDAMPGNKYFKWIKPKGELLIALSDFIAKEFCKNYKVKPDHVIPVGIDPTMFGNPASSERDIDILGAGSLIPLKQYYLFIDAIKYLKDDYPNIRGVICGKGPEFEPLQAMIKSLHLEKNIELMGELPHTCVLALMQRAKIFVHTSAYEGFGVVCLEALYAGAHVVSFVKPMDASITHWHFTQLPGYMLKVVRDLLANPGVDHCPVLPYPVNDSTKAIIKLFDYNEAAIS
jgi:glycosyltransferase involved in cell wall biosynthesis